MVDDAVLLQHDLRFEEFLEHYGTERTMLPCPLSMAMAQWIPLPSLRP